MRGAILATLLLLPSEAASQIPFLSNLLGKATDVNAYYVTGTPIWDNTFSRAESVLRGFGTEVTFDVGSVTLGKNAQAPRKLSVDTIEVEVTGSLGNAPRDTTLRFTLSRVDTTGWKVASFDVTIGYSLVSGLRGAGVDTFDIQAGFQELPMVAFYVTFIPDVVAWKSPKDRTDLILGVAPYVGVRTGLVQLHGTNARFGSAGTQQVFSSGATSYQIGAAVGLLVTIGPVDVFGEVDWVSRRFRSIEWTSPGTNQVPAVAPRSLNLSARTVAIGAQFTFNDQ